MSGRPREPNGRRNNVCTKLSDAELAAVKSACGDMKVAEWARHALLAAAAAGGRPDPLGIKIVTDERMPPGTAALISRDRDKVSVSAFSLGADQDGHPAAAASAKSRTGGCSHRLPAGAYCKTCGAE